MEKFYAIDWNEQILISNPETDNRAIYVYTTSRRIKQTISGAMSKRKSGLCL